MINLAVFASGSGTNAENIIRFFRTREKTEVKLVLTNKPDAGVINRANSLNVECFVFNRDDFKDSDLIISKLQKYHIDFIVLAGFLWLVPEYLLKAYPNRIVNIHPALLPKYGGKGMYGSKVHEAVVENKESESGITIHYVNENYDEGNIIFQARCTLTPDDTPDDVAAKVHQLEYEHYPRVIEEVLKIRSR